MCLLLVLYRVVPEYPIIVAANRDEQYGRKSLPPAVLSPPDSPAVLAPRDAVQGGTWIGVNSADLFVAVTNRPAGTPDPTRRSRGVLCLEALSCRTAGQVAERVEESLSRHRYNPFNLICAKSEKAYVYHVDQTVSREELEPGLHVLSNLNDLNRIFVDEIIRTFDPLSAISKAGPEQILSFLGDICRDHTVRTPEGHAICKHFEERGTVSSTLAVLPAPTASGGYFRYSSDAPCREEFADWSEELTRIRAAAPQASRPGSIITPD